jgi:hypothetical protein
MSWFIARNTKWTLTCRTAAFDTSFFLVHAPVVGFERLASVVKYVSKTLCFWRGHKRGDLAESFPAPVSLILDILRPAWPCRWPRITWHCLCSRNTFCHSWRTARDCLPVLHRSTTINKCSMARMTVEGITWNSPGESRSTNIRMSSLQSLLDGQMGWNEQTSSPSAL